MPLHIVIASLSPWICTKSHGFSPMLVVPCVPVLFLLSVVAGPRTVGKTSCQRPNTLSSHRCPPGFSSTGSHGSSLMLLILIHFFPICSVFVIRPLSVFPSRRYLTFVFLSSHLLSVCAVLVPPCVVSVASLHVLVVIAFRFCPLSQ